MVLGIESLVKVPQAGKEGRGKDQRRNSQRKPLFSSCALLGYVFGSCPFICGLLLRLLATVLHGAGFGEIVSL